MIERKKSRKRKPSRFGPKKHSGLKNNNFHNKSVPRSRNDISRALEKYNSLAQDAQSNGDRIVAENFFQWDGVDYAGNVKLRSWVSMVWIDTLNYYRR